MIVESGVRGAERASAVGVELLLVQIVVVAVVVVTAGAGVAMPEVGQTPVRRGGIPSSVQLAAQQPSRSEPWGAPKIETG